MRTGKWGSWAAGVGFLAAAQLLTVAGCRQTCNHCGGGSCDGGGAAAGPAPAAYAAPPTVSAPTTAAGYAGQRTCPVTGAALAGVGRPVPVTVNGETVYVCCENCARKVRQGPEPYLARVRAERAGAAPSLAPPPAPAASALPLGGQKNCPVTGEPLDPSTAVAVTVRGQTVYVCCQGCAAKVRRDPERYLAAVTAERTAQASPVR